LLGLVIGFSLSMALSRYGQRKNHEEAEANAIGTEYMRADPPSELRRWPLPSFSSPTSTARAAASSASFLTTS